MGRQRSAQWSDIDDAEERRRAQNRLAQQRKRQRKTQNRKVSKASLGSPAIPDPVPSTEKAQTLDSMPSPAQDAVSCVIRPEDLSNLVQQRTYRSYREEPSMQHVRTLPTGNAVGIQAGVRSMGDPYSIENYQWLSDGNDFCGYDELSSSQVECPVPFRIGIPRQGALQPPSTSRCLRSAPIINSEDNPLAELEGQLLNHTRTKGDTLERPQSVIECGTTQCVCSDGNFGAGDQYDPGSVRNDFNLPVCGPCHKLRPHPRSKFRHRFPEELSNSSNSHISSTVETAMPPTASNLAQALAAIRASGFDSLESFLQVYCSHQARGAVPTDSLHGQWSQHEKVHRNPDDRNLSLFSVNRCCKIHGNDLAEVLSSDQGRDELLLPFSSAPAANQERLQDGSPQPWNLLFEMTRSVIKSNEKSIKCIEEILKRLDKAAGPAQVG